MQVVARFTIGSHKLSKEMELATVPTKGDLLHYDELEPERVKEVMHLHLWPDGRVEVCLESGWRLASTTHDKDAVAYFSDQGWSVS